MTKVKDFNEVVNEKINSLPDIMRDKVKKEWDDSNKFCDNVEKMSRDFIYPEKSLLDPPIITNHKYRHKVVAPGKFSELDRFFNDTEHYLVGLDFSSYAREEQEKGNFEEIANFFEELKAHKNFYCVSSSDSYYPYVFYFDNSITQQDYDNYKMAIKDYEEKLRTLINYSRVRYCITNDPLPVPVWYILEPNYELYQKRRLSLYNYNYLKGLNVEEVTETYNFLIQVLNHKNIDTNFTIPQKYIGKSKTRGWIIRGAISDFAAIQQELEKAQENNDTENIARIEKEYNKQWKLLEKILKEKGKFKNPIFEVVEKEYNAITNSEKIINDLEESIRKLWENGWDFNYPLPPIPEDFPPKKL